MTLSTKLGIGERASCTTTWLLRPLTTFLTVMSISGAIPAALAQSPPTECLVGEGGCGRDSGNSDDVVKALNESLAQQCFESCQTVLNHCGMISNDDPDLLRSCAREAQQCLVDCSE